MTDLSARKLSPKFTAAWVIWILLFVVIEAFAVMRRGPKGEAGGDTLSEHVWHLIGTRNGKRTWVQWVCRILLAILFGWLIPHFFTGWLRG